MTVKPRERNAILQSLSAGVVPRIGLEHIQVGRKDELNVLIDDLRLITEDAASIRFVIGRFGSGKSFFLNLIRTVALEQKFVTLQADITLDRRFHSTGGHAVALYTELIQNMSTRVKPTGNAMPSVVETFVSNIHRNMPQETDSDQFEEAVLKELRPLLDFTHGASFVKVMARYVEGFAKMNDDLVDCAKRWLRGEYGTRTEARQDLGVRDIVEDNHLYDILKVWAAFVRIAGYRGLFVNLDELVVISERLNNSTARSRNYEVILQILNDCLQGGASGIGFCLAGTEDFLTDSRRGLYSYEALRTRLQETAYAQDGVIDPTSPVIRLKPLTQEELFVLLERIHRVHVDSKSDHSLIDQDGIVKFMKATAQRMGAEYFLTPRDVVRDFISLLNAIERSPGADIESFIKLGGNPIAKPSEDPSSTPDDELTGFTL